MALIFADSICAICGGRLDRASTATSGCAFPEEHPLWRYCDAPLHLDCLEHWPHRGQFSRGYFDLTVEARRSGYGHLLARGAARADGLREAAPWLGEVRSALAAAHLFRRRSSSSSPPRSAGSSGEAAAL